MIEMTLKNSSHSKDRHVVRARTPLGHPIFDHLTLQKSSGITVDGVQLNGVDHTLPGFCTKEMHYPTESHVARSRTRVARLFPNEASCLRLVTAVVMEISEEWETGKVYLTFEQ